MKHRNNFTFTFWIYFSNMSPHQNSLYTSLPFLELCSDYHNHHFSTWIIPNELTSSVLDPNIFLHTSFLEPSFCVIPVQELWWCLRILLILWNDPGKVWRIWELIFWMVILTPSLKFLLVYYPCSLECDIK